MKVLAVVSMTIFAAVFGAPARAADKPEDLAQSAAESWLTLADAGDGGASWDQAAKRFQGKVTKEQWMQTLASGRRRLGKVVSRKVTSRQYSDKSPRALDTKHVVIQYETVFEGKGSAVETVTPMLDPDGVWRVAGYVVR